MLYNISLIYCTHKSSQLPALRCVAAHYAAADDATVTTEVGRRIIDWKPILRAAEKARVADYFEQEPPFLRPPLESLGSVIST